MPFRRRFRRTPFRRPFLGRKRKVPDLVPFVICRDCMTVQVVNDPCTVRNEALMTTASTVMVDGGAFSALGDATMGMTRGLKFRGMRFDLRLDAGYKLGVTDNQIPAILNYAVGITKVTAQEDTTGRHPAVLPNLWATADEFFNGDLVYLRKGRVFVPPAVATGSTARTSVSLGSNDGLTYWDRLDALSQPGAVVLARNFADNQIHHRVKTRRNVNESEMLLFSVSCYSETLANVNGNHSGNVCPDAPAELPVNVTYNVEGMLILENWPS